MECNDCTKCCESLPIVEIHKPENVMCKHCDSGCTIYPTRPISCRNFDCVYLLSDDLSELLRPDKTGVIFEKVTTRIYLALVTIDDWETDVIKQYIEQLNNEGISVIVSKFGKGILEVFTAEHHERNKVVEISMRFIK